MAVPTYDRFIDPVLRILQQHPEGMRAGDVHEAAADALQLTSEERQLMLDSGHQAVYKNRAGWAHDRLKRAGLSSSQKRGLWQLTDAGLAYAQDNPGPLPETEVNRIATGFMKVMLGKSSAVEQQTSLPEPIASASLSPDDQLEQALGELRRVAADELLERLLAVAPSRFESIVLDVLHGLGYGTSRHSLQRVGGSGDAGIDGVISLDKLGLEKVYVQAKRWQNSVGRPELQAFYGALAGQKAKRGVFLTTSDFTIQAKDFAASVEGIVLINGNELVKLMIDTETGISSRTFKVPKIDQDYFE